MIASVYRLTAPGMIEVACRALAPGPGEVLIRPRFLSICKADQRYYQGQRSPEVLRAKLPMALLHECVAEVIHDPAGRFAKGAMVVPVPNLPCETDDYIAENYLYSSRFRSSGTDGYLQEYVLSAPDRLVPAPTGVAPEVSAFLELVSVSMHAISRFERFAHGRRERLGVWGDGNLGYITALLLRALYPQAELTVLGISEDKLSTFTFAERKLHVDKFSPTPKTSLCDHAFECVGGPGSRAAINQIIDAVAPEGTIALLGVSENFVDVNTRMVLEKGLRLYGSSRSGTADFARASALLSAQPQLGRYLESLIGNRVNVRSIADIHSAFRKDLQLGGGKTVLEWNL
jgi:ribitol-5-phosphate 2-dehydrogenase